MFPLSFVFAVFAFTGILLMLIADDDNYRKLGLYIFLVFFLIMALQMLIDYPMEQLITTVIIGLAVALFMIVLLLDLLKIFQTSIEWVNKRR